MHKLLNQPDQSLYLSDQQIEQLVENILGPRKAENDAAAFALMTIIERLAYDQDFTVSDNNAFRLTEAIFRRTQAFETAAFAFAERAGATLGLAR